MAKALIIAEKKSLADVYRQAIKQAGGKLPYEYDVLQFQGNVVELLEPEDIKPEWKTWKLADLPMLPQKFQYTPIKPKASDDPKTAAYKRRGIAYFKEAKQKLLSGEYELVVNGCDPDREGQSIFDKFMLLMPDKIQRLPQLRLWVGDMQVETSLKYLQQPLNNKDPEYVNFGYEAMGRGIMDWLFGLNASRAFSLVQNSGQAIHLGRGMTAILALVVKRQAEIENFVSQPYWTVQAKLKTPELLEASQVTYPEVKLVNHFERQAAEAVREAISGQTAQLISSKQSPVRFRRAPKYFNTSDIIAYLSSATYHLSGASITKALQHLYELKITTYPRTSGREMTPSRAENLAAIIAVAQSIPSLNEKLRRLEVSPQMLAKLKANRYYVKPLSKKTGHDCLTFTGRKFNYASLNAVEQKVVAAIAFRLLLSLLPSEEHLDKELIFKAATYYFQAKATVLVNPGWTAYVPKFKGNYSDLPQLVVNQAYPLAQVEILDHKTQAPKAYTTASLIKTMENIGRLYDDPALKAAIKDHGIGTDATRQLLIDKNEKLGYWSIDKKSRLIRPTKLGRQIIQALGANPLTQVQLTALWEEKLAQVAAGQLSLGQFVDLAKEATVEIVAQIKATPSALGPNPAAKLTSPCPLDGGDLVAQGQVFICSNHDTGCPFIVYRNLLGAKLTAADLEAILTKGKSNLKELYSAKTHKHFQGYFVWNQEKGKVELAIQQAKPKLMGACPLDGGKVYSLAGGKLYACEHHQSQKNAQGQWESSGCPYYFSGRMYGKKLTQAVAKQIIETGSSPVLTFTSKKRKKFTAILKWNQAETKLKLEFAEASSKAIGVCPLDGGQVSLHGKAYLCENHRAKRLADGSWQTTGCPLVIPQTFAKQRLSLKTIKQLLKYKRTDLLTFTGQNQRDYQARLIWDEQEARVKFEF